MQNKRLNVGILLPGISADENDWAIPVQHNLMQALSSQENVRILALRYPHRRKSYRLFDATVHPLGYTHEARRVRRLQLWTEAFLVLRKLHRKKPFDILHAMWADETGAIAVWAGKLLKIPVVVSVLGGEIAQVEGYGLQHSAFSRWLVGQAMQADKVLVACSYVEKLINQLYSANLERLVLGVDAERFLPKPELRKTKHLIQAASLVPVKDQATLLRAFARLPEEYILDILGEGPERAALEFLAKKLNIAQRVNFCGAVAYPEMPAYFQRASLHLLSSLHEGLGMVTLEAAACGIPTVSTNVGIVPDFPQLGIAVPVGDDAALAEAIQQASAQLFDTRACVEAGLTISQTVAALRRIYQQLIF
jgi:glycosyltransferase involved in cell wall biosynthesis